MSAIKITARIHVTTDTDFAFFPAAFPESPVATVGTVLETILGAPEAGRASVEGRRKVFPKFNQT